MTTVYWDDDRPCSANAIRLIKKLYPDCSALVALVEKTYEVAQLLHGAGPRVDADVLAAETGYSVDVVVSDDETLLNRS